MRRGRHLRMTMRARGRGRRVGLVSLLVFRWVVLLFELLPLANAVFLSRFQVRVDCVGILRSAPCFVHCCVQYGSLLGTEDQSALDSLLAADLLRHDRRSSTFIGPAFIKIHDDIVDSMPSAGRAKSGRGDSATPISRATVSHHGLLTPTFCTRTCKRRRADIK